MLALRFVLEQADIDAAADFTCQTYDYLCLFHIKRARLRAGMGARVCKSASLVGYLRRKGSGNRDVLRLLRRSLAIRQTNT